MAESQPHAKEQRFEALAIDALAGEVGDVIIELRLPRESLAVGAKVPVSFARRVVCSSCKGTGRKEDQEEAVEQSCSECHAGFTKVETTAEVDVPPGSGPGMQLRVAGQGHMRREGPQGDVVVVISSPLAPETSEAAQKLPAMMVFFLLTIVVLVLAMMMAR